MNNNLILWALSLIFLATSCQKDPQLTHAVKLTVDITVKSDENLIIPAKDAVVTISNKTNGASYQATIQENGQATFESITPGTYTINSTLTIPAAKYMELAGYYVEDDVNFSGSNDNIEIFEDKSLALVLQAGKTGSWVFKQIYYAGSNASTGAVNRDVFVEIYNNSNQILYADSLYFGQVIGKNNNNAGEFYLENNQYDWSKALNMSIESGKDANKDYIYAHTIFRLPSDGTGKKYPVQPGSSIIIAATAVDHTNSYESNTSDRPVTVTNPELTINLNNADFEVNLVEFLRPTDGSAYTPFRTDVDNINVPNVDVIHVSAGNDLVLNALGRDAYFIADARSTNVNIEAMKDYAVPDKREITATTPVYKQLPIEIIIDAVELQHPIAASRVPKRLQTILDAGRTFVPGGQYSSQSLVRKTLKTVNGRRILKDTNNSEVDFGYLEKADPSKTGSSFID
ncbi:MAG TPA: DUF4876 domain-containing protein [Sphingobacterium bovisgrunnientis]|nr:DUF4876 domain-containing protein [Sphingobacterium bovisgrunnientis]